MRLFTAITFSEEMKDYLAAVADKLRLLTVKGSFTLRDNYHLTLNFIGETGRLEEVQEAMRQALQKAAPGGFLLQTEGFGSFRRREGDICYIRVKKSPALFRLQREMARSLKELGFELDEQEYRPHLTLSRRTVFAGRFDQKLFEDQLVEKSMEVSRISLMKSERLQGKLTYTEVYGIDLE